MTALSSYLKYIERYLVRCSGDEEDQEDEAYDEEKYDLEGVWPFPPDFIEYDEELYWYPYAC